MPESPTEQPADDSKNPDSQEKKGFIRKILMLDDTPHSIALGTAIGMWIAMTPTVGAQMIIVLIFAFLTKPFFHFNRLAAILTVYVSNPFTVVPIYYFNYWVGSWFVEGSVSYEDFAGVLEYDGFEQWWDTVIKLFVDIGWPLILGSIIVATICAIPTYPAMLWMIRRFKETQVKVASVASPSDAPEVDDSAGHTKAQSTTAIQSAEAQEAGDSSMTKKSVTANSDCPP